MELARFLTSRYGGTPVAADEKIPKALVRQRIKNKNRSLTQPNDTVLIEAPSYFLAKRIFESNHLHVRDVPMDEEGVDTTALEKILSAEKPSRQDEGFSFSSVYYDVPVPRRHNRPRLMYVIPVHNNPSAVTLSEQRRRHLVRLAHEHDITLIADEVYHMLTHSAAGTPPPLPLRHYEAEFLQQQGRSGCSSLVLSLGSFSKILAPGLRLG